MSNTANIKNDDMQLSITMTDQRQYIVFTGDTYLATFNSKKGIRGLLDKVGVDASVLPDVAGSIVDISVRKSVLAGYFKQMYKETFLQKKRVNQPFAVAVWGHYQHGHTDPMQWLEVIYRLSNVGLSAYIKQHEVDDRYQDIVQVARQTLSAFRSGVLRRFVAEQFGMSQPGYEDNSGGIGLVSEIVKVFPDMTRVEALSKRFILPAEMPHRGVLLGIQAISTAVMTFVSDIPLEKASFRLASLLSNEIMNHLSIAVDNHRMQLGYIGFQVLAYSFSGNVSIPENGEDPTEPNRGCEPPCGPEI